MTGVICVNMLSKLSKRAGIRTRLIVTYICLILVPMFLSTANNYMISRNMIYDVVSKNVQQIVKKNNEILDQKLKMIRENCWNILSDKEFIDKSSASILDSSYKMIAMDIELTKILDKYFLSSQDISFAQLITSRYIFGYSTTMGYNRKYIPISAFMRSELYEQAVKANGKLIWYPTYDFSEMFGQSKQQDVNPKYRYMFSALQCMKTSGIRFGNGGIQETTENPILILNFGENFYHDVFKSSMTMDYSYFFVVTKDGQVVAHQNMERIGAVEKFPWLDTVYGKRSGQDVVSIDGRKTLICYDTSAETGWLSVIAVDYDSLMGDIISSFKWNSIYLFIALALIMVSISYFVSNMISKPIIKLSGAIKKTGEGDFTSRIPEDEDVEFNGLIHKYNSMNEKIQRLIKENYEIQIREKEAEINALTLQLDPHFMYNMLNMLNLKLIQNGQDEASEMVMSLSAMLKYTARNKKTLVPFEQELDYLKGYINIMSKRFEGKFSVEYIIDPDIYRYNVPKFLLQPFVENSLLHGFATVKEGGVLRISCCMLENGREYIVEDNGGGMSEEKIDEILKGYTNSVGIVNIINRIRIIYGNNQSFEIRSNPGEGTVVRIRLPLEGEAL